jgi:hypothetical protein
MADDPTEDEKLPAFLERMAGETGSFKALSVGDAARLCSIAASFFDLDCQAATHVESVICMRSAHFTGEPPYTGWKGLGKALREDYDDLSALKEKLNEAREIITGLLDFPLSPSWLARARAFLKENANG